MPPSTKALARAALVPLTVIGLVASLPGTAQASPASADGFTRASGRTSLPIDQGANPGGDATRTTQPAPTSGAAIPDFDAGPTASPIVVAALATLDALRLGDSAVYDGALLAMADAVAVTTGLNAISLAAVWRAATTERMAVLAAALSQVGVSYRYASATPGERFDCSGLVSWAWSLVGRDLPHQSRSIIDAVPRGDLDTIQPGDVLWYPGHISLALGIGDAFVDAPGRGKQVRVVARHGSRATRRLAVGVVV